jgi:taurine transport system permease protein
MTVSASQPAAAPIAGTAPPARKDRRLMPSRDFWLGMASVAVILAVWEAVRALGLVNKLFLPTPTEIWIEAQKQAWSATARTQTFFGTFQGSSPILESAITSTRRVLVGFAMASLAAVPLGVIIGTSRVAKAISDPVISLIRPLPSLSWIPLSILWFGIGEEQKYMIVFMGTFASALLYVMEATRRVDPLLIKAARNLGASQAAVMREVVLPGSLPGIISGLKVCLALAWTTVLSAEMVAATRGLGALIWFGKDWNRMDIVMVGMACISLTVLTIDTLFRRVEHRLLPWERHRYRK